ncbi:XRE family transcriptional regulator [Pseudomonas sp. USHLN015]|uniref:XRE family transcriptional regulator n=1 Tax=Pseudomonas sp. USHLN015 TaxID=3081296 RepID=UPI00301D1C35
MTPLKKARIDRKWRLADVVQRLRDMGEHIDTGNLSRIERCEQRASPFMAEKLVRVFEGVLTEIHVLYPERFVELQQKDQAQNSRAA